MTSFRLLTAMTVVVAACGSPTVSSLGSTPSPSATETTSPTIPAQGVDQPIQTTAAQADEPEVQACADVIDASAVETTDGSWRISATVRSGDTGWDKYADEWAVHGGGVLLGTRALTHPHETEQPFTRALDEVIIPVEVIEVEVSARDSVNGFCGESYMVTLER